MHHQPGWKKRERRKPAILLVLTAVLIVILWVQRHKVYAIWSWHPFVGMFIAILAFFGVLLTFREHIGGREKAVWIVVMTILVGLEFRSMYLYNQDELSTRGKQFESFNELEGKNDKLQGTLNTLIQFIETHQGLTRSEFANGVWKIVGNADALPLLTNARLDDLTKTTLNDLAKRSSDWSMNRYTIRITGRDLIGTRGLSETDAQREVDLGLSNADKRAKADMSDLVQRACDLRTEIFNNRLDMAEKKQWRTADQSANIYFAKLKSGTYGEGELGAAIQYLRELQKVLESHIIP